MEYHDDDKAKAARSQLDLCQRMAEEIDDPQLAEKLRNLVEKLKSPGAAANRSLTPPLPLPDRVVNPRLGRRGGGM